MNARKDRFGIKWTVALTLTVLLITFAKPCLSAEDPAKFPSRPITMIVNFGVGGVIDLTARMLSELAGKILGQPVVLVNKSGGAGIIGNTALAQAAPDGYTIGTVSYSIPITPHIRQLPYDVREDFTYILTYAEYGDIFFGVQSSSPWKTFKEFIEDVRKAPGKYNYSTPGPLGGQHILMQHIFDLEKVTVNHVPGSGAAEAVTKLLGGHLEAAICSGMMPYMSAGKLRALAIQGQKNKYFPNVPTLYELGYKTEAPLWQGMAAPKNIGPQVLAKLSNAFKTAANDPTFYALCDQVGFLPLYRDPKAFKELVLKDYDVQGKLLKSLGLIK